MGFTVFDALATPALQGAELVGGWTGLARTVQSITVAEVPDASAWLDGGELILTTGYMYRVFRTSQERFLPPTGLSR